MKPCPLTLSSEQRKFFCNQVEMFLSGIVVRFLDSEWRRPGDKTPLKPPYAWEAQQMASYAV